MGTGYFKATHQKNNFILFPRPIIRNPRLSEMSKMLYAHMADNQNGRVLSDAYFAKVMEVSTKTIERLKRELKEEGVLVVVRTGAKSYSGYIAATAAEAIQVKNHWERESR